MNININYDLINTIEDNYKKFTPFKFVKYTLLNNSLASAVFAGYTIRNIIAEPPAKAIIKSLVFVTGIPTLISLYFVVKKEDPVKRLVSEKYNSIPDSLKELRIKTDTNLLKNTKLERKEYTIRINENKIPQLLESKHILVPSVEKNGEIKNVPVVQEHPVFTKKYVLSKN